MKLAGSDKYLSVGVVPEAPRLPLIVVNDNCSVFCKLCHSTITRKPFFFGKRSCDNKECKSHNI